MHLLIRSSRALFLQPLGLSAYLNQTDINLQQQVRKNELTHTNTHTHHNIFAWGEASHSFSPDLIQQCFFNSFHLSDPECVLNETSAQEQRPPTRMHAAKKLIKRRQLSCQLFGIHSVLGAASALPLIIWCEDLGEKLRHTHTRPRTISEEAETQTHNDCCIFICLLFIDALHVCKRWLGSVLLDYVLLLRACVAIRAEMVFVVVLLY